jgi:hypothetical protein
MPTEADPIRVFVGLDRSQLLGCKVLERSIRARTAHPIELTPLADLPIPALPDPRHQARTGFSFARFAIPDLAGRTGRALYLDADMLVLRDISEIWNMPFGKAKVICQEELPLQMATSSQQPAGMRKKQCSVMLLDCAGLDWNPAEIVAGLGSRYTYEQLMQELCILPEDQVSYALPVRWNSLEHLDQDTCLIHYTDMLTQPWVYAANPNGWIWIDEVRAMLAEGSLSRTDLAAEIEQGYARPSLISHLDLPLGRASAAALEELVRIDAKAGYRPHATLIKRLDGKPASWLTRAAQRIGRTLPFGD